MNVQKEARWGAKKTSQSREGFSVGDLIKKDEEEDEEEEEEEEVDEVKGDSGEKGEVENWMFFAFDKHDPSADFIRTASSVANETEEVANEISSDDDDDDEEEEEEEVDEEEKGGDQTSRTSAKDEGEGVSAEGAEDRVETHGLKVRGAVLTDSATWNALRSLRKRKPVEKHPEDIAPVAGTLCVWSSLPAHSVYWRCVFPTDDGAVIGPASEAPNHRYSRAVENFSTPTRTNLEKSETDLQSDLHIDTFLEATEKNETVAISNYGDAAETSAAADVSVDVTATPKSASNAIAVDSAPVSHIQVEKCSVRHKTQKVPS